MMSIPISIFYWSLSGVFIGLLAFSLQYFFIEFTFPAYSVLVAPAIFALSFFSEETAFVPKMIIFLTGQYLGYLILILSIYALSQYFFKKS